MNLQNRILVGVFCLLISVGGTSQSSATFSAIKDTSELSEVIDSIYSRMATSRTIDLDQIQPALKSSLLLKDTTRFFKVVSYIVKNYFARNELNQEAILFVKRNQELIKNKVTSFGEFDNILGNFYRRLEYRSEAIDHYYKSLSWHEKYDPSNATIPLGNISATYYANDEYLKALKYAQLALGKSLELNKDSERFYNITFDYSSLGSIYHKLNEYSKATLCFDKSFKAAAEYGKDKMLLLYALSQALIFYSDIEDYKRCDELIEIGDDFCRQYNKCESRMGSSFTIAKNNYYLKIGALDKAMNADTIINRYSKFQKKKAYSYAVSYYTGTKDLDKLIVSYDKLISLNDTISSKNRKVAYSAVEEKYVNQKLSEKNQELTQRIENRNRTTLFILLILSFILGLLILQRINSLRYKEVNQELQLKKEDLEITNQELARSNEELERFTYIVSHDLKTPLRGIISFTNLLERQLVDSGSNKVKEYLAFVKEGGMRLHNLISDSLEYSRYSKRENSLMQEEIDLNKLLDELKVSMSIWIEDKNANLVIDNDLPSIQGHYYSLVTLFQNLIENGIKYNRSQVPTVKVRALDTSEFYKIFIEDNGIGVEEEYRDKIFDMFYRLHNQHNYSGSGLGLSISKKIVDRLNGQIKLYSNTNGGSIFEVVLPKRLATSDANSVDHLAPNFPETN